MNYVIPDYLGELSEKRVEDFLRIKFVGKELSSIGSYTRAKNSIKKGSEIGSWEFVAPNEIMENVSHDWEEFEGFGQKVSQKYISMRHAQEEALGAVGAVSEVAKDLMNKKSDVSSVLGNVNVPQHKVDTTLVYKNSKRKEYSLEFEINFWKSNDPKKLIFEPIRELEKFTCAEMGEGFTKINFPAIFNIKTYPNRDLINLKYAAITSIQPTWMAPYINGYPTRVRLTIMFTDIQPLYRKSWEQ